MNIIKDLLVQTPQQQQKQYESYLHLHLKNLMTAINKAKVQDLTQPSIRKNICIEKCYVKNTTPSQFDPEAIYDTIQEIRDCKNRCGAEKRAIKQYLDDINYYSELKIESCLKSCPLPETSSEYNLCKWGCLNRLDRRYKKYWVEQRKKIQDRFSSM